MPQIFHIQELYPVASPGFSARRGTCKSYWVFYRRQLSTYSRCQTLYRSKCTEKNFVGRGGGTCPSAPSLAMPVVMSADFGASSMVGLAMHWPWGQNIKGQILTLGLNVCYFCTFVICSPALSTLTSKTDRTTSQVIKWQQVQSKLTFARRESACRYDCTFL